MGIRITDKKSKMPNALKLVSHISTFLFEEEYGELKYMKASEIEAVKKVVEPYRGHQLELLNNETMDA